MKRNPIFHLFYELGKASKYIQFSGLVSSGISLISRVEGASLALVGNLFSDGDPIKIPHGIDFLLHQPVLHPIFSYRVGYN